MADSGISPRATQVIAGGRALLHRDVAARDMLDGLLDHAIRRQAEFSPAKVYYRGDRSLDQKAEVRDCARLTDLGPFRALFGDLVAHRAPAAVRRLGLAEGALEPVELELCAYGDGGQFQTHVDVLPPPARVRVLTCVFYFHAQPKAFDGGDLRIHPWPGKGDQASVDLPPEHNSLVMFPSFLRHQVLPVRTRSPAWADRRFNLTCWLCRPIESPSPV